MKHIHRLFARVCLVVLGTLAVSLPAVATTNEESMRVLHLKELVLPIYPDSVKQEGLTTGIVTAVIAHDASGQPTDVMVVDSTHPRFTAAVREAVNRWKFDPVTVGAPQAPLVRFYFISKGVVLLQSPGMRSSLTGDGFVAGTVSFPTFGSLDASPKAIEQPMPVFPAALRGRVAGGSATVRFYVDESGHARAAAVTEATSPEFADAAKAAVEQWRYEAPRQNGRAVIAVENWNFRFSGPAGS
jgi:TonB family protein